METISDSETMGLAMETAQSDQVTSKAAASADQPKALNRHRQLTSLLTSGELEQKVNDLLEELFPQRLNTTGESSEPGLSGYFDQYELLEEIGQGAFSRVFKAIDTTLGNRLVVLKIGKLGHREIGTAGRLNHKYIMPVYSSTIDELGVTTICMPYLGRNTLRDKLEDRYQRFARSNRTSCSAGRQGISEFPVSWKQDSDFPILLKWFEQTCLALQYAHNQCVLHLDVKPSNILLGYCGNALLLDFNLARDEFLQRHASGGTLSYMSPEQLQKCILQQPVKLDERSDVYSLGVTMFEAFYGFLPFHSPGPTLRPRLQAQIMLERQQRVESLFKRAVPGMPTRVRRLLQKCLGFQRASRFDGVSQVLAELRQIIKRQNSKCLPWLI